MPGSPNQIRTEVTQLQVDWELNDSVRNAWSLKHRRFCVRLVCTAMAAIAFVVLCWAISHSVNSDTRILAGPILLFSLDGIRDDLTRSLVNTDLKVGGLVTGALLPSMLAVGVWRNWATVVLSILACICWVGFGLWVEVISSI
jgi:hypothetical protein